MHEEDGGDLCAIGEALHLGPLHEPSADPQKRAETRLKPHKTR